MSDPTLKVRFNLGDTSVLGRTCTSVAEGIANVINDTSVVVLKDYGLPPGTTLEAIDSKWGRSVEDWKKNPDWGKNSRPKPATLDPYAQGYVDAVREAGEHPPAVVKELLRIIDTLVKGSK